MCVCPLCYLYVLLLQYFKHGVKKLRRSQGFVWALNLQLSIPNFCLPPSKLEHGLVCRHQRSGQELCDLAVYLILNRAFPFTDILGLNRFAKVAQK